MSHYTARTIYWRAKKRRICAVRIVSHQRLVECDASKAKLNATRSETSEQSSLQFVVRRWLLAGVASVLVRRCIISWWCHVSSSVLIDVDRLLFGARLLQTKGA